MDTKSIKRKLTARNFKVRGQSFRFECFSLRPFTRYYVVFDKLDFTQFCEQEGKRIGEPLISDAYGKLKFKMFWNRENEREMMSNPNFDNFFDTTIGNKLITITDKSGTSFINKTIFFTNNNPEILFDRYKKSTNIVLNN